jgi:GNAT superfamily N-acetyltransferase
MTAVTQRWRVEPVPVPEALDAPEAWAIHAGAAVRRAVELARLGHDDLASRAPEILAFLEPQDYERSVEVVALPTTAPAPGPTAPAPGPDDVVGYGFASMPTTSNPHLAYLGVEVHPERRRLGAGSALLAEVERIAIADGRTVLIAWTEQLGEPAPGDPDALRPPTGSGLVRATEPGVRMALDAGYLLEQAERYSVLHLPVDPTRLADLHDDAARRAGDTYRVHTWSGPTPREFLTPMALLHTRMSTDVPTAGLDMDEDPWDEVRVQQSDEKTAAAGKGSVTTAVEHRPTGELVAYSQLNFPLDRPEAVHQEDTLVLHAHRGHRLGMLAKTTQLIRLRDVRPQARRVHTWNAEENEHMLAINVALGFRPTGVVGMWQKRLS